MSIDLNIPQSRRALLGAVVGGLAATAANAIGKPAAALATDGQPVLQGVDNGGSASTVVRSNNSTALQGVTDAASGTHYGVRGRTSSTSGAGIFGLAAAASGTASGVLGQVVNGGGVGVMAVNDSTAINAVGMSSQAEGMAVYATATGTSGIGVRGIANSASGITSGVRGEAISTAGTGVVGIAHSATGVGVAGVAIHPSGIGLRVTGKATFTRSGKATVPNGQSQVTVMGIPLTASSLVLATIQGVGAPGLYIRAVSVSVSNSRFTIRLSQNVTAATLVGWFIAN